MDEVVIEYQATQEIIVEPPAADELIVEQVGARGLSGTRTVVVGPDDPHFTSPGVWFKTGLGSLGDGMQIWIEDGT